MTAAKDADLERTLAQFAQAIEGKPNYARNLLGVAEFAASKALALRAFALARQALAAGGGDPEIVARARRLLGGLVRGYHVGMMNDARRNEHWSRALARAVRPGAAVLEIGTGAGMLALMAARAGAGKVTTCERDPILAAVAREMAALNGYGDRIDVIAKPSLDLVLGVDLARPAELLFCDVFADTLIGIDPLPALADARRRLVAPGAPVIPAAGAIRVALADYADYARTAHLDRAAGFDLAPFADFAPAALPLRIGDRGLRLRSGAADAFRFDFAAASHPEAGRAELDLEATQGGVVNGIVQWIRLELDAETALEARPEPGAVFFSGLVFYPLPSPRRVRKGESLRIVAAYAARRLDIWAEARP